jgi:hypothetical protein
MGHTGILLDKCAARENFIMAKTISWPYASFRQKVPGLVKKAITRGAGPALFLPYFL